MVAEGVSTSDDGTAQSSLELDLGDTTDFARGSGEVATFSTRDSGFIRFFSISPEGVHPTQTQVTGISGFPENSAWIRGLWLPVSEYSFWSTGDRKSAYQANEMLFWMDTAASGDSKQSYRLGFLPLSI